MGSTTTGLPSRTASSTARNVAIFSQMILNGGSYGTTSLLDPKLVKFQFQVSTIAHGFDAAEYFTKYPGRFISMHVQGWSAQDKKIAAVGQDSLDWKKIFSAAKVGGIKNYFVEMNLDQMKASVPYLRGLQV